ncbi:MAG: hypothetical protein ABI190_10700 [Casimicrobiaceae bacterium]
MPLYKDFGVISSGLSLADRGRPGRYIPFASIFAWSHGAFRLARQFAWSELEQTSADAAKATAEQLAQRAIDCGDVG